MRARVAVHGSGRAGLACALALARAGYAVCVHDSNAGAYDAFEAFDGSAAEALRALGVDAFAACGARAVRGFNGEPYVVARRSDVRAALAAAAAAAGVRFVRAVEAAGTQLAPEPADPEWIVDATGRSALRTRVEREPPVLAYLFAGPPADALAMQHAPFGWGYRIGDERGSTVGVVVAKPYASEDEARGWAQAAFGVTLDPAAAARRAAGVQRCLEPVAERRIAIGDAAFAQDPMNGQGQSFALTSAALAAATIRTCAERPPLAAVAHAFYTDAVARAARRGNEARASENAHAADLWRSYAFAGAVRPGGALCDGLIEEVQVVAWDGRHARWSGGVDLLDLAEAAAGPSVGWHVIDRLARRGIDRDRAVAAVSTAIARGLLQAIS